MKRKGQDIRTFFKKRSVNQRETEEVETQKDSQSVEEETQKVSQSVEVETQKDSQSVEVESQKDSPEPPEDTTSPTGPHGSYAHEKWLKVQQEMFKGEGPRELQRLSDTRWACSSQYAGSIIAPETVKVLRCERQRTCRLHCTDDSICSPGGGEERWTERVARITDQSARRYAHRGPFFAWLGLQQPIKCHRNE
ncbi:unnamed protein product [Pleuronectes platessa]|uniref:Uncharacterized protein n=1 Tax=Pleuronectes platessa TaxID=8262 RepID=A0A9N7U6M5_PLEPL|nr:unnamed protein product [Pleuronectes platessa]